MIRVDRSIYQQVLQHSLNIIDDTRSEMDPFPHLLLREILPELIYKRLLDALPSESSYVKANAAHHSNEYGESTRRRIPMCEAAFATLPPTTHTLLASIRAAISSTPFRNAIFSKVAAGLCRRFRRSAERLVEIPAFPRGTMYRETEGYRIAPHPDTREKIVTMQFALPHDESQRDIGTEFYKRSLNPWNLLREPRGFVVAKTMPFLPNHAYAFAVLNEISLKSWHGRSTVPAISGVRNSLLHIWYTTPDATHSEVEDYQNTLDGWRNDRDAA